MACSGTALAFFSGCIRSFSNNDIPVYIRALFYIVFELIWVEKGEVHKNSKGGASYKSLQTPVLESYKVSSINEFSVSEVILRKE
jgi:hypothetical protein